MFKSARIIDTVLNRNDIPDEVQEDIVELWSLNNLGNDNCYFRIDGCMRDWMSASISERTDILYPYLMRWLCENFDSSDQILIHHWW
jgi:hypothetical protein